MKEEILKFRLQYWTTERIAEKLNCSRRLIEWYLAKIYKESDMSIIAQLDDVKEMLRKKARKINLERLSGYQLGIVWSIGYYSDFDNTFIIRHNDKYFLEQIEPLLDSEIYSQKARTGTQYVLKSSYIDIELLKEWGWTERNAEKRNIPLLDDYKDFLRAYFEIHSCLDYCTAYTGYGKKNQKKYKRLRLRVYGNYVLIQSINNIICQECKVLMKSIQYTHNRKTAYLQYTANLEITAVYNWLTGNPCNEKIWMEIDIKLKEPTKCLT